MMKKIQIKKRDAKQMSDYAIGYANLQHLLTCREPFAYYANGYGWRADYYRMDDGTVISTGYQPDGESVDYEIQMKYDKKAQEILGTTYNWNERKEQLDELIEQFLEEIKEA